MVSYIKLFTERLIAGSFYHQILINEVENMSVYNEMTKDELKQCSLLAAEAFYDYEYFSIYIPEDKRRKRFLNTLLQLEFHANFGKPGVVFLTARENGRIAAVAQLCAPDFKKPSDAEYIRRGWVRVLLSGGIGQVAAWHAMEMQASAPCHELTGKNWYLSLLTVAKDEEGKGIGGRFLNNCLIPYVKNAGGETLSLFTNSEINRRFYESHNFTLFDEKHFEYNGGSIGSWSYMMKL